MQDKTDDNNVDVSLPKKAKRESEAYSETAIKYLLGNMLGFQWIWMPLAAGYVNMSIICVTSKISQLIVD